MTPEGKIKAKVKRALKQFEAYAFMPVQNGMGAPSLDFINCIGGYFIAIETKVPWRELTPRQKATSLAMKQAGGTVFVIREDADITHMVSWLKQRLPLKPPYGDIYDALWHEPHCRLEAA